MRTADGEVQLPVSASDTTVRLDGLSAAVDAARGRLDDGLLDEAAGVVRRGRRRLGLSSELTIVALAGATGSGKSSLFNALCDLDLAAVGVKRPTTSWALACVWGSDGASEVLNWLDIPERHRVNRTSLLDEDAADRDLHGLVLLDLPDHDSTEVSHHLEVERLVELADVLVWVLDPQKYADAAIHDRYLRPLYSHAEVMLVVLNQVDQLMDAEVDPCLHDVRRLLLLDGLAEVPVIATSAVNGDGIAELRDKLVAKVSDKRSARERIDADAVAMAQRLDEQTGSARPASLDAEVRAKLLDACADSADVPVIVKALESTSLIRARRASAWPVTAWLSRWRTDPMSRLPTADAPGNDERVHVDRADSTEQGETAEAARTTARLAQTRPVPRTRVDIAVGEVVDDVTTYMAKPWEVAVRDASTARLEAFAQSLESTFSPAELSAAEGRHWSDMVRWLQWALMAAALGGGAWLLSIVAANAFDAQPSQVRLGSISLPLILLGAGLGLGLLIDVAGRVAARPWARRKAAAADSRLRAELATKFDELVVDPLEADLEAYRSSRQGLRDALRR